MMVEDSCYRRDIHKLKSRGLKLIPFCNLTKQTRHGL